MTALATTIANPGTDTTEEEFCNAATIMSDTPGFGIGWVIFEALEVRILDALYGEGFTAAFDAEIDFWIADAKERMHTD